MTLIISLEDTELLAPLRLEPLLPPDSPSDGDSGGEEGVEAPARELADSPVRVAVLVSGLQTSSKCAIRGGLPRGFCGSRGSRSSRGSRAGAGIGRALWAWKAGSFLWHRPSRLR